jgi:hypothetical protein
MRVEGFFCVQKRFPHGIASRGIFCSRTLSLRSITTIGYDMDYTLIHYNVNVSDSFTLPCRLFFIICRLSPFTLQSYFQYQMDVLSFPLLTCYFTECICRLGKDGHMSME